MHSQPEDSGARRARPLGAGVDEAEILSDYPYLERNDIRACLAFAAAQNGPSGASGIRPVRVIIDAQLPPALARLQMPAIAPSMWPMSGLPPPRTRRFGTLPHGTWRHRYQGRRFRGAAVGRSAESNRGMDPHRQYVSRCSSATPRPLCWCMRMLRQMCAPTSMTSSAALCRKTCRSTAMMRKAPTICRIISGARWCRPRSRYLVATAGYCSVHGRACSCSSIAISHTIERSRSISSVNMASVTDGSTRQ